jgi:hypothetical protein
MTKSARTNPTNSIPTLRRVGPTSPPTWIKPQLAELVEKAPDGPDWSHEIKFDVRGLRWTRKDGSRESPRRAGIPDISDKSAAGMVSYCSLHCPYQGRLRKRDRSFLVSAAGPRVFVPSSRRCRAISRPASAFPIFACVHCLPVGDDPREFLKAA